MHGPSGNLTEGEIARELVRKAQRGDLQAFEELYRMHVDRVYAICFRLTSDEERAEKLTQDAFVKAWEKLKTFRWKAAFTTWLHRLTVNTVLQEERAISRLRHREISTGDLSNVDSGESPKPTGERIDLERAIAQLPERARIVFVLHDIEGYRHKEIAEMMGTSAGTSKAQLHRARTLLRKVLDR